MSAAYSREEVFGLVRDHLVEELSLDPAAIREDARFKEDLEADSLDLVELVVELEDRYGVRIPENQAEKIKTIGDAVEYVIDHLPAS